MLSRWSIEVLGWVGLTTYTDQEVGSRVQVGVPHHQNFWRCARKRTSSSTGEIQVGSYSFSETARCISALEDGRGRWDRRIAAPEDWKW